MFIILTKAVLIGSKNSTLLTKFHVYRQNLITSKSQANLKWYSTDVAQRTIHNPFKHLRWSVATMTEFLRTMGVSHQHLTLMDNYWTFLLHAFAILFCWYLYFCVWGLGFVAVARLQNARGTLLQLTLC